MASREGGFRIDRGWERFKRSTDARLFQRKFQRHRKAALDLVSREIISQAIKLGSFERNAALTQMIKGSDSPLEDSGKQLVRAFRTRFYGNELFVGIPMTDPFYMQAKSVHDGVTLKVTDKMRQMFIMLWLASNNELGSDQLTGRAAELFERQPKGWLPLRDSTQVIKIPARPFMTEAFSSPEVRAVAERLFTQAVERTLAEMAGR